MKQNCLTFLLILLISICDKGKAQISTFKIISNHGDIDTNEISKLDEALKAVAALYSSMAGTSCDTTTCELTTALGLGDQGSEAHKSLIKKYFPNDKVAKAVIKQDCYLSRAGSSNFSGYEYLTLTKTKDTVTVYYKVDFYNHGEDSMIKNYDGYLFRDGQYKMFRRKFWSWADK
jgi:hypothetical protein